jgi:hypothetical protein
MPPTAFFAPSLDDLGAAPAVVDEARRDETAGRVVLEVGPLLLSDEEVTVLETGLAPMEGGGVDDFEGG